MRSLFINAPLMLNSATILKSVAQNSDSLTNHLPLVVDHHRQVLEDLVHVQDVGLKDTADDPGRFRMLVLWNWLISGSRASLNSMEVWSHLQLSDVGLSLSDELQVLLSDGHLLSLGADLLTPVVLASVQTERGGGLIWHCFCSFFQCCSGMLSC